MRISFLAAVMIASFMNMDAAAQEPDAVPFAPVWVNTAPLAQGYYVFRDSSEWAEKFVREFPSDAGPPPAPDLSDSLIVALSYGMTGCYETGGGIESIALTDNEVRIDLGHVYKFNIMCLAEIPRVYYYRIAHDDVPSEASFQFVLAQLPYDVEPERWYPLAVGNAWHFRAYGDFRWIEQVEVVEGTLEMEGETWYHVVRIFDDDEKDADGASRYLRWSEDAFLLTSTDPSVYADTVHPGFLESPFLVDVPRRDVPLAAGGVRRVNVGKNNFQEFNGIVALWDDSWEVLYAQGVGPLNGLMAAIIDGEHYEDTSLILTVLSSERPAEMIAGGRIDVYPHPATTGSIIAFVPERSGEIVLELFDLLGREVMSQRASVVAGTEWQTGFDPMLPPGAYFVRVSSENGNVAQRTIIVAR